MIPRQCQGGLLFGSAPLGTTSHPCKAFARLALSFPGSVRDYDPQVAESMKAAEALQTEQNHLSSASADRKTQYGQNRLMLAVSPGVSQTGVNMISRRKDHLVSVLSMRKGVPRCHE